MSARLPLLALGAALCCGPGLMSAAALASAQGSPQGAQDRGAAAEPEHLTRRPVPYRPVRFTASLMVGMGRKKATFSGDVTVVRDNYRLTCDRLIIYYTPDQKIDRLVATGDVKVVEGDRVVTAGRAVFDNKRELLTLTEDPVLTQGQNVLRGEVIRFDLPSDQVRVERVRASVQVDRLMPGETADPKGAAP